MRYLWLTRWPAHPPLRGGAIDYSGKLIRALAGFASVEVLSFERQNVAPADTDGLSFRQVPSSAPSSAWSAVSTLPNVAFRHAGDRYAERYVAEVLARLGRTDAVVVDFIAMFWIVPRLATRLAGCGVPLVLINHNHEGALRRQMTAKASAPHLALALALDAWKASRLERLANRAADGFVVLTEADGAAIRAFADRPYVVLAPGYTGTVVPERRLAGGRVCILGGHAAPHKKMVLERALDAIERADLPDDLVIDIVGDGPPLAKARRRVNALGYVADIDAYLSTVALGILPDVIGGGFKLRALDHVFRRVPMLAVENAVAGMGLRPGLDYVEAPDLDALAAAIPGLVADTDRLDALQASAFSRYAGRFDWATRGRDLHAFVGRLARERQVGARVA